MTRKTCLTPLAAAVVLVVMAAGHSAKAMVVGDPDTGYTFELPDDWKEILRADVYAKAINAGNPGSNFRYSAGFEPAAHTQPFQSPYLLISFKYYGAGHTISAISEPELRDITLQTSSVSEAVLKKSLNPAAASELSIVGGISASYFTDPPGFVVDMDVNTPSGLSHLHRLGYLGRARAIGLDFVVRKADYGILQPVINRVASTFALTPTDQVLFIKPHTDWSVFLYNGAIIAVLVGTPCLILMGAWRMLHRRK